MLAKGFVPDVISSDVHALNIDGPVFDLIGTLSKFYCLGLDLPTLVRTATSAPAAAIASPRSRQPQLDRPATPRSSRSRRGNSISPMRWAKCARTTSLACRGIVQSGAGAGLIVHLS